MKQKKLTILLPLILCLVLCLCVSASAESATVDLRGLTPSGVPEAVETLKAAPATRTVLLGDEKSCSLSWDDIYALHEACPTALIDYSFSLYGVSVNLSDTAIDLKYHLITDEGAHVREVIRCMPALKLLEMDHTEVSNEAMAALRDDFPEIEVVWWVTFGDRYGERSNTEMILASCPELAGELIDKNTENLKYFTKVKYLDLGHNNKMSTLDFLHYMPDLEVAILAMINVDDFSILTECPKLEYLELFTTRLHDLTPLGQLDNLRHLNICYNFSVRDISPLYRLTKLERLWIGKHCPVPPEQIEEMQRCAPDCVINVTTGDPTEEGWRLNGADAEGWDKYDDRYALLREQFDGYTEDSYSIDPKYYFGW